MASSTGLMSSLAAWAAATAAVAMIAYALVLPSACDDVQDCIVSHASIPNRFDTYSAYALAAMLIYEIASLASTFWGARRTKELVRDLESPCLPSLLLVVMFAVLVLQHSVYGATSGGWYAHARPTLEGVKLPGHAVYTFTYIEWLITVPLLLTVAAHCALGRPLEEVHRPVLVTNIYIVFAWAAQLITNEELQWTLVTVTLAMYAWASYDMVMWVVEYLKVAPSHLSSRCLRPCLALGLIAIFAFYGVVYMSTFLGLITSQTERMCHLFFDVGSKLAMAIVFVAIRAIDYHDTLAGVLRHMSTSNRAMISILRGSFDVVLPCIVDDTGICKLPDRSSGAVDIVRLEGSLRRPVGGASMRDLLVDDGQRERFESYVRNVLRQSEHIEGVCSDTTMSTQVGWSCGAQGKMPPVAQVLNCKMALGEALQADTQPSCIQTAVHLAVVPQPMGSYGTQRQLVVAMRFGSEDVAGGAEYMEAEEAVVAGFDAFNVDEAMTMMPESNDQVAEKDLSQHHGIVANLYDLAVLGVKVLSNRDDGSTVSEGGPYASSTISSSDASWHLGARASLSQQNASMREDALAQQLQGSWCGTVSKDLGGYGQTLRFLDNRRVEMFLLGDVLVGQYWLSCAQYPYHMDIQVLLESAAKPVPIPYVVSVSGNTLSMCGPGGPDMKRPTSFTGPGVCHMRRVDCVSSNTATLPSRPQTTEPERFTQMSTVSTPLSQSAAFSRACSAEAQLSESDAAKTFNRGCSEETCLLESDMLSPTTTEDRQRTFGRADTDETHLTEPDTFSRASTEERKMETAQEAAAQRTCTEETQKAAAKPTGMTRGFSASSTASTSASVQARPSVGGVETQPTQLAPVEEGSDPSGSDPNGSDTCGGPTAQSRPAALAEGLGRAHLGTVTASVAASLAALALVRVMVSSARRT